jgi:AraC-like DNA-binding protein
MSGLVRYMPQIPLGEFVDYLYVNISADSLLSFREPTHPVLTIHTNAPTDLLPYSHLKGVFTQALPKNSASDFRHSIGIRFKPYGMYTGFGIRGDAVANRIVPSSIVFSKTDVLHIREMLQYGNDQAAIEQVHEILYDKLEPRALLYEITDMLDALVAADLSKNSQRKLALAFERSPKSFIEVFKKAVGITPLNYLHIHKIDTARQMIREQPLLALTEVAYLLGFYDQAHFIRVFRKHTGYTPVQYKKALNLCPVNSVQF